MRNDTTAPALPPASEIFPLKVLSQRHPTLLPENRLRWMVRNRHRNGLIASHAVFESPLGGELLFHEPATIAWLLGLSGRSKPRSPRKAA